jgi:peptidoglycan/xylan/chitin deacetylase (PgdA/CDA1 family)
VKNQCGLGVLGARAECDGRADPTPGDGTLADVEHGRRQGPAFTALASLVAAALAVLLASCGASSSPAGAAHGASAALRGHSPTGAIGQHPRGAGSRGSGTEIGGSGGATRGAPGTQAAPILIYHVINSPPAGAPFPGLYVRPSELAAQMRALFAAGYRAVTLDQLLAYWREGVPLPPGKPIVLSFDNGYQSQYTQALPILRVYGWAGVENLQLSGLPPSQGGLSEAQVRGLIAAGWELDTQGYSHAELTALPAAQLHYQVAVAREILRRRYGVPVNWFCYPSGHYDAAVIAEVMAAGYVGATTVLSGWASPSGDPYRLPRIRVLGGTSPQALLQLITAARGSAAPPPAYS